MMMPWELPIEVQEIGDWLIARDDLVPGGTKVRFLPALVEGATELVYGGPFCGGAAIALAVVGKYLKIPVTLFYAKRTTWHPRQLLAESYGAKLIAVPMGFQSHVTAVAKHYAEERGARYFPLGYDLPEAMTLLLAHLYGLRSKIGQVSAIYSACSSGMLTEALAMTWPDAQVIGTCVGLKSKWGVRMFPPNVRLIEWPTILSKPVKAIAPPFNCCPYYEQKAWQTLQQDQPTGRVLFWNVLGDAGTTHQ